MAIDEPAPRGFSYLRSLWELLREGDDGRLVVELALMAIADVMLLYSLTSAMRAYQAGEAPTEAIVLFVTSSAVSTLSFVRLLKHASLTFNAAMTGATTRILGKLQALDLAEFEALQSSSVLTRLTADTTRVIRSSALLVEVLKSVGLVALSLVYFMTRSTAAAVLGFGALAILTALTANKGRRLGMGLSLSEQRKGALLETATGMITGIKQVKLHEPRRADILAEVGAEADLLEQQRSAVYGRFFADDALGFAVFFSLQAFIALGIPLLLGTEKSLTRDLLLAIWYISASMGLLLKSQPELTATAQALDSIRALESRLDGALERPAAEEQALLGFEALSLEDVTYRYKRREGSTGGFQLGPLDVTLRRGELVFVTGGNGSGKSTLLKLLTGLYRRDGGRIGCDGAALAPVLPQGYRDLFSVILSDFVLFDRLYGMEDESPARVTALLERMELQHKITFAGGRFSSVKLSTGQRKRLAMVIALLQDRPIYVFDEWAADQDPEFRAAFYREILPELKARGKTVIAVTHDDDYFSMADRRVHLQNGRLEAI